MTAAPSTGTGTGLLDRERTSDEGPKAAHIVHPPSAVTEAYINGTPVTALCGHVFVPSRDPKSLPVCSACKEIYDSGAYGRPDFENLT